MMIKQTKFYIEGEANGVPTDIMLMPDEWRKTLTNLEKKFKVKYDEETDTYYVPRKNYLKFKRATNMELGFSVNIYALRERLK